MFNMYDDGLKIDTHTSPLVGKTQKISHIVNEKNEQYEQAEQKANYEDITQEAKNAYKKIANIHVEEELIHAYEIMNSDIISVQNTIMIFDCWKILEKENIKQLAVTDENGKIKGLISMNKIAQVTIENINNSYYIYENSIKSLVNYNIITAEPITDIRRVAQIMVNNHINTIPIVSTKKDEVLGLISRADILKAISTIPHFQFWA